MPEVALRREGRIAWIVIASPPDGLMTKDTVAELAPAVAEVAADPAIRAVILTGGLPGVFIRHYSIAELLGQSERMRAKGRRFDPDHPTPEPPLHVIQRALEDMPKPVIAAINGTCMGGGFELALACDFRLAEAGDYPIGLPEVNMGFLPGAGGTQRLPRLVGMAKALELILMAETVSPAEALRLGLVHAVAPSPVAALALAWAQRLASKPPEAIAAAKRLIREQPWRPPAESLGRERTLFAHLMTTDECHRLMRETVAGTRTIRDEPNSP